MPEPSPPVLVRELEGGSSPELSRPFVLGAGVVVVAGGLIASVAQYSSIDAGRARDIRILAGTTTVICAIGAFVLTRALWRQLGDRTALWAGCGTLIVGLAAACRPELLGTVVGERRPGDRWLEIVATAAMAVAPLVFGAGLSAAVRRVRVTPAAVTAGAVVGTAALALLVHAVPRLAPALTLAQLTSGGDTTAVAAGAAVVTIWLAGAVGWTLLGLQHPWRYSWVGLMLFSLTLAGLAAGAATSGNEWSLGAVLLEAMGLALAVVGAHLELNRVQEHQTLKLFDTALEAETADVRERVRAAGLRARRHDLINAITAIDGAAMILEREFQRLSESDREALAHVVGSGSARLRALLTPETPVPAEVSLAETAEAVARDPAWPHRLHVDVRPDLLATGSPGETAEAVRQLVDYASRRAPTELVSVRGERDGPWVVLRVEDRGPTMPRELRRAVTDPDSRPDPGQDDAMGVRIAARLMRGQGGDLWVQARPDGGTAYCICLPALRDTNGEDGAPDG